MKMKQGLVLDQEILRKLQLELLEMLVELDKICKKHDIKYYLYGGTLLGAVRHEGFIPWDDDIDVAMFRKDYNKFKEIIKKELDEEVYFFQTQESDRNYNWVFGRMRKNNTLYMRVGQEHLKHHNGIFIDVFPLDNISSNKFKQRMTLKACKILKRILWAPVGSHIYSSVIKRNFFKLLEMFPKKLAIYLYEFFAIKINSEKDSLIASHNAFSIVLEKEWYKDSINLQFEGYKFKAPIKYHEFLKARYGDYMKLPPKEERYGHHYTSYIKFSDGNEIK